MLRNLGTPIHYFEQLMRAIFLRSSLIASDGERSEFGAIGVSISLAAQRDMGSFRLTRAHFPKKQKIVCEKKRRRLENLKLSEKNGRARPCGGNQRFDRLQAVAGGSLRNPTPRHSFGLSSRVWASAKWPDASLHSAQGGSQRRGGPPVSQMTEKSHNPLDQKGKTAAIPGGVFAARAGGASRRTGLSGGW
jgi:hypothetical protein